MRYQASWKPHRAFCQSARLNHTTPLTATSGNVTRRWQNELTMASHTPKVATKRAASRIMTTLVS